MLRKIFVSKTEKVTGCLKKVHEEEFCNFYASPNVIRMIKQRRIKLAGYVASLGKKIYACVVSVTWPAEKGPLRRHRSRWWPNKTDRNQKV